MWAYMTTGTTHFLKNLVDTHRDKNFYFMKNRGSTLVYYEDSKKKGIFVSGRSYHILYSFGEIHLKGFVVMQHIPVMEEEAPVFEERIKKQLETMNQTSGVLAIRLLKEKKKNQYIITTQWKNEQDYHAWQKMSENTHLDFSNFAKLPAYFADRPFTNTYYMLYDEEEK